MPFDRYQSTSLLTTARGPVHGLWRPPAPATNYERLQVVTGSDLGCHDLLAGRAYGKTEDVSWWLLAWHNHFDPFTLEVGDRIRLPDFTLVWPERIPEVPPQSGPSFQPTKPVLNPVLREQTRRQL